MVELLLPDTPLLLGDRVFGAFAPELEPTWYHVGAWHLARRQWVLFREDRGIGAESSLGMTLTTEELIDRGFTRALDRRDVRTPVYIIITRDGEERSIEVAPGTDPTLLDSGEGHPSTGNGPRPDGY